MGRRMKPMTKDEWKIIERVIDEDFKNILQQLYDFKNTNEIQSALYKNLVENDKNKLIFINSPPMSGKTTSIALICGLIDHKIIKHNKIIYCSSFSSSRLLVGSIALNLKINFAMAVVDNNNNLKIDNHFSCQNDEVNLIIADPIAGRYAFEKFNDAMIFLDEPIAEFGNIDKYFEILYLTSKTKTIVISSNNFKSQHVKNIVDFYKDHNIIEINSTERLQKNCFSLKSDCINDALIITNNTYNYIKKMEFYQLIELLDGKIGLYDQNRVNKNYMISLLEYIADKKIDKLISTPFDSLYNTYPYFNNVIIAADCVLDDILLNLLYKYRRKNIIIENMSLIESLNNVVYPINPLDVNLLNKIFENIVNNPPAKHEDNIIPLSQIRNINSSPN